MTLAAGLTAGLTGCGTVVLGGAAISTVVYLRGNLSTVEPIDMDAITDATIDTLVELEMLIDSIERDERTATVIARRADEAVINIHLRARGPKQTQITIRIDTFGDRDQSRHLLSNIRETLHNAIPSEIPGAKPHT